MRNTKVWNRRSTCNSGGTLRIRIEEEHATQGERKAQKQKERMELWWNTEVETEGEPVSQGEHIVQEQKKQMQLRGNTEFKNRRSKCNYELRNYKNRSYKTS